MSGEVKIIGTTLAEIKIFNITRRVAILIIHAESSKYDLIVGLDLIPIFKLNLSYELKLTQSSCENKKNNNISFVSGRKP